MMTCRTPFSAVAALMLAVAGCAPASQTGQTPPATVFGTVAGGATRAAMTGSRASAARGAMVVGAAGSVASSVVERQRAAQQAIGDPEVQVLSDGSNVVVIFPGTLLFGTSPATLTPAGQRDLLRLAQFLQAQPGHGVVVMAHTDDSGSFAQDQLLTGQRARAVSGMLVAGGVAPGRIATQGHGATRPVAPNDGAEGRARNRRVEIVIRPPA